MNLTQFEPDKARALAMDAARQRDLAASLRHLADATLSSADTSGEDESGETGADIRDLSRSIAAQADRIAAGFKASPLAFATYFQLAEALTAGDRDGAWGAVATLETAPERSDTRIIRWVGNPDDTDLTEAVAERNRGGSMVLAPLDTAQANDFADLLGRGFDLMNATDPALFGEIDALNHEVLLGLSADPKVFDFDGASHYQFWGLVMLNPAHHHTPVEIVEVLAHEISHGLLFGMTTDEPLVFNPDSELYPSPLRQDPRPMDGIFHAAYVSARMAMAMERLAASPHVTARDRAKALDAAALDRENFAKGDSVITEHGRLSETGRAALEAARNWMARTSQSVLQT